MNRHLVILGTVFALAFVGCQDLQTPVPDLFPPDVELSVDGAGTRVQIGDTLLVWQPSSTLQLRGSATDEVGVTRVTYASVEGAEYEIPVQPGSTVSFSADIGLMGEVSRVAIRAYDAAGNHAETWVRATVDSVPPALEQHLQAPARFPTESGGEEIIGWHPLPVRLFALQRHPDGLLNEPLAGLAYRIDAGEQVVVPAGCLYASCKDSGFRADLMLAPGSYTIQLSGHDRAGNTSSLSFPIRVVPLPTASFEQPDTTVTSGVESIRVTGRVYPTDGVNLQYFRRIPGDLSGNIGGSVDVDPETGRFSFTVPLRMGDNQISVGAGLFPVNDWYAYAPLLPGGNGPVSAEIVVTRGGN